MGKLSKKTKDPLPDRSAGMDNIFFLCANLELVRCLNNVKWVKTPFYAPFVFLMSPTRRTYGEEVLTEEEKEILDLSNIADGTSGPTPLQHQFMEEFQRFERYLVRFHELV